MKKLLTILGLAAASFAGAQVASAQVGNGVQVSLTLASGNLAAIAPGSVLTYNLNVSGLKGSVNNPGAPVVGGYDLTLNFDATFLTLTSTSVNYNTFNGTNGLQSYLGPNDFQDTFVDGNGALYLTDTASASAQQLISQEPAAFTMATITFQALRSGTGSISFDPSSSSMSNEAGGTLDVVRYTGAAVPEPGTYAAVLLGVVGLGCHTLRRRRAAQA